MSDDARMSGPCNRGSHDACRSSKVCGCDCHLSTPAARKAAGLPPALAAVPDAPDGIVWGDPPPTRSGRQTVPDDVLDALRARPGEWARVRTYDVVSSASTAAKKIKTGANPAIPAAEFEAVARKVGKGSGLWLRYVGGES